MLKKICQRNDAGKLLLILFAAVLFLLWTVKLKDTQKTFPVVINEIAASNDGSFQDEDGDYPDWIELYNDSDQTISLKGFGLSDQKENPQLWRFPDVTMEPYSYLLVCASGKDREQSDGLLHTNFKISSAGETIYFSDSQGRLLSFVEVPKLAFGQTYGRVGSDQQYDKLEKASAAMENSDSAAPLMKENPQLSFSHPAGSYEESFVLKIEVLKKRGGGGRALLHDGWEHS